MMESWASPSLKRRASDASQYNSDETGPQKRARCEGRSASLPNGGSHEAAGYSLGNAFPLSNALPQSSSSNINGSPISYEHSLASPTTSMGCTEIQSVMPFPTHQAQHSSSGWIGPSNPINSESSEQTMEDISTVVMQSPQIAAIPQGFQPTGMSIDGQRCNSAPDLRVLLDSNLPAMPPYSRLPEFASTSTAGAIVPFKGPQDVIRDAVFYELRKHVKSAVEAQHPNFESSLWPPSEACSFAKEDNNLGEDVAETSGVIGALEAEPMDILEG